MIAKIKKEDKISTIFLAFTSISRKKCVKMNAPGEGEGEGESEGDEGDGASEGALKS